MLITKSHSNSTAALVSVILISFISSCGVVPKNYPYRKPFVFQTNINLEGSFSKEEKSQLKTQLEGQLDDSIRVRTIGQLYRSVLKRPPVYDSSNAERSVKFMNALLVSQGYFKDSISYDTTLILKPADDPRQYRTIVNFYVKPGKQVKLDSISYVINNTELQVLTDANKQKTLLKKGDAFSKQTVLPELNRLVDVYRNNGYLRFSFDELVGVWDTLNVLLLQPSFDPFEQIQMLDSVRRKRIDNPTANLEIRLRPGYDVDRLKKYYVGHSTVYTDTSRILTKIIYRDTSFSIYSYHHLFKPHFIIQNIYLNRGDLYSQEKFLKTVGRFNSLGAWRLVNIEQIPRPLTDTVDFEYYLTPAIKYSFTANIETSRNNSLLLEEKLWGIGVSGQLLNRNFGHSANQSTTIARYATELSTKGEFVKTRQASISQSIYFPKPIPNSKWIPEKFRDNFRTVLNFSLGNIDRKDYFNLTSLNASWGYNFSWKNKAGKDLAASFKPLNIEYAFLNPRPKLIDIFNQTPSFRNIFNTGLVVSTQAGFQVRWGKGNVSQLVRTNIEESGGLTGLLKLKALDSLFRFIKTDIEYIRNIRLGKNSFVIRAYAGAGFALKTRTRKTDINLPFFKQFYAGGPNSMRAWGLRSLGPGATLKTRDEVPFRFGDFQFETNAEYRFPLGTLAGFKINSCVFTDIGNVWFLKPHTDFPDAQLTTKTFLKNMAVDLGTGIRIDFDFFLLRLDYALKVKNPTPEPLNSASQNKWFSGIHPLGGVLQLGINYPFSF